MSTIDRADANRAYSEGNNAGRGFAPDTEPSRRRYGDGTVDDAVAYALRDGWVVVYDCEHAGDMAVLRHEDGRWIAIGGDGMGRQAWAVDITSAAT